MSLENVILVLLYLTSVTGLAVILWRAWALRWSKVTPTRIVDALSFCRTADDLDKLQQICVACPSPLGRLVLFAANHLAWPKAENVSALETAARREVVRLESGLFVLEIIVGIAPLLGLVGTIIGMMTVFSGLGDADVTNAAKLAHGISVILRATLIGLLIAIPALAAWGYFSKKVEVLTVEMETLCDEFIRRQYVGRNQDKP